MSDRDARRRDGTALDLLRRRVRAGVHLSLAEYATLSLGDACWATRYLSQIHPASARQIALAAYAWHAPARACSTSPVKPRIGPSLEHWILGLAAYGREPLLIASWTAAAACLDGLPTAQRAKLEFAVAKLRTSRVLTAEVSCELREAVAGLLGEVWSPREGESPPGELADVLTSPWRRAGSAILAAISAHEYSSVETSAGFAANCVSTACHLAGGDARALDLLCAQIWPYALFEDDWSRGDVAISPEGRPTRRDTR